MAVRMTDDQPDQPEQFNTRGGGGRGGSSGGGGGLFALLPILIKLLGFKGILIVGALALGAYFFMGDGGCGSLVGQASGFLSTGGLLDPERFQKAAIYESLEDDNTVNPLPEAASLQRYAPQVGNQGSQGSCVGWSSAFAARTILEAARTGNPGEQLKFSPAFLYNQIGLDGCQGSYLQTAMEFMTKQGSVPYEQFPYTDQDCTSQPSNALVQQASNYRMRGFNRLTRGDNPNELDLRAIKENLSQGAPVVIGMMVGQSFMQNMMGEDVWRAAPGDESMMGFGGHAMCVVGYDDKKYGGSFLIMNSWGPEWGNNGFAWVRYPDFKYYVREAYGLEPMTKVGAAANAAFACELGLVQVEYNQQQTVRKGYLNLKHTTGNRFESRNVLSPGTRFKLEVQNSTECYTYVFGKETDGSSYTLFPYPEPSDPRKTKYSPFCGITGVRLFPKDKSMELDNVGTRDEIAIVVSKQPLDWYKLNENINRQTGTDYAARVGNVLKAQAAGTVTYQAGSQGTIQLKGNASDAQVAYCIIAINKSEQ